MIGHDSYDEKGNWLGTKYFASDNHELQKVFDEIKECLNGNRPQTT